MKLFPRCNLSLLIALFITFSRTDIKSQETVVEAYLGAVEDYSTLYNGKIEPIYSLNLYENLPYYRNVAFFDEPRGLSLMEQRKYGLYKEQNAKNLDFASGEIIYKNRYYPNLQLKLDLYKEQLIVLSPEKHYGVLLDSKEVQKATFYGKTFIWYDSQKTKDLKAGFYMQLYKGNTLTLLSKISMSLNKGLTSSHFDSKTRSYLLFNENYYQVKNKNSFRKIFPQYKNQINRFSKEQKLDFGSDPEGSLVSLARYCESLFLDTIR